MNWLNTPPFKELKSNGKGSGDIGSEFTITKINKAKNSPATEYYPVV